MKEIVVPERFMRSLKNKVYKYMTLVLKNVYIDKLADIINQYNNTYIMKPVDVIFSTNINSDKKKMKKIKN